MESINFFIINNVGEVISVLSTDTAGEHIPVLKAGVDSKLSSYDILEIVVPADSAGVELIKEDYTIVFKDITGWREYVITSYEDIDGDTVERTITAELSSIELLDEPMLADISTKSTDPEEVLAEVLSGTRWTVGQVDASLYNRRFSGSVQYKNVLEVIDDLSSHYSAEITFTYEVSGNQVVSRRVNMLKQVGNNNGKRFEIDKDVLDIKRTVDTSNIKTAIIPYGPGDEEAGEGLDIAGVEWRTANGDPVDKPLGQLFLEDVSAKELWGRIGSDGKRRNRFITMEFQGEDAGSMASMAWVQLGRYSKPKITYEGKVVDLYALSGDEDLKHEQVALGDTAVLIDNYFAEPLAVSTRVVELYRDLLDPINNEVVLGESKQLFKAESGSGVIEDKVASLAGRVSTIATDNKEVQAVINSKSSIYYGSDVPANPYEGDIWFKPHGTVAGETTLEIFNGTVWDRELDTSRINVVEEEVRKAEAETEALKQIANDAYKAGQDALAGVSNKVDATLYAQEKATLSADIAKKVATDTYNKKVAEIEGAVSGQETRLEEVEGGLALTAKATDVDALKSRVSTAETSLTATNNEIALKANKTDVDAVAGRLSTAESSLTLQAGQIASKVSQTDFNAVTKRLSTAESNITQQASNINLRVSKNDVINQINLSTEGILIDAKNIHLSGKSKIDDAVIKSAMIESLSADKINVGTLNGNNVNIINLKANNITGGNLDVKNVKIMNGTTEVLSVNSSTGQITMNVNGLTINTKPVATNEYVTSQASSAETRAKAHADTKASTAESNAKTYAKQQVDAVEVGGRNLLRNSEWVTISSNNNLNYPIGREFITEEGRQFVRIVRDDQSNYPTLMSIYSTIPIGDINASVFENEQTVISFKARASKVITATVMQTTVGTPTVVGNSGDITITKEWQTFYTVFPKIPKDTTAFRVNPLNITTDVSDLFLDLCEWKIEKGNKPTAWTPAPEDIQEELNTKASSDVTDGLETALNDLNTVVAELGIGALEQQLSEYQEVLTNVQGDIESAEAQLATILSDDNGSLTKINTVLDGFNQRWQTLDGFIEFTGDGSSMTISKGNTSMVLNSDALTFFSGGSVVATITGQYMKIDRGIFVESMHIGRHEFAPYLGDRNHFLLQYVGEPTI